MNKIKRLKYSSYAVLVTVTVIAAFIFLTLLVSKQSWNFDVTKNKIYSLSDQTKQVLSKINQDINVYVFYIKGREDINVSRLLDNYRLSNPHIKVEYLESVKHPDKLKKI